MILLLLLVSVVAADDGAHGHEQQGEHHSAHARDQQGDQAVSNAINKLDQQFLYLLSTIASMIIIIDTQKYAKSKKPSKPCKWMV